MNRVEVSGGMTRDGELRFLPSGAAVYDFTLAVNEARWSKKDGAQVVFTTYVSCQAWASLAEEMAERNLGKGDEILVLGRLSQSSFEKSDGTKETKTRVTVQSYSVVRSKAVASVRPEPVSEYVAGEEPF